MQITGADADPPLDGTSVAVMAAEDTAVAAACPGTGMVGRPTAQPLGEARSITFLDLGRPAHDFGGWMRYFPAEAGKSGNGMKIHRFSLKSHENASAAKFEHMRL